MVAGSVMAVRHNEIGNTGVLDLRDGFGGFAKLVRTWLNRHRIRRNLARLNERLCLEDIDLTPGAMADEVAKPFWQE